LQRSVRARGSLGSSSANSTGSARTFSTACCHSECLRAQPFIFRRNGRQGYIPHVSDPIPLPPLIRPRRHRRRRAARRNRCCSQPCSRIHSPRKRAGRPEYDVRLGHTATRKRSEAQRSPARAAVRPHGPQPVDCCPRPGPGFLGPQPIPAAV
jgi:hypothetical protein